MDNQSIARETVQAMIREDGMDVSFDTAMAIEMCIKRILDHLQDERYSVIHISGKRAVEMMVDEEGLDASETTLRKLEKRMDKVLGNKEDLDNTFGVAQTIVDKMVEEDGLEANSTVHKKMEQRIQQALEEQTQKTKKACVEAIKQCPDMNEMTETDLIWIDLEDAVKACDNA